MCRMRCGRASNAVAGSRLVRHQAQPTSPTTPLPCSALLKPAPAPCPAHRRSGQSLQVLPGLLLPAQYSWVASLALTTLLVPQASFPAHLCGVLAGLAKAYLLEPGGVQRGL